MTYGAHAGHGHAARRAARRRSHAARRLWRPGPRHGPGAQPSLVHRPRGAHHLRPDSRHRRPVPAGRARRAGVRRARGRSHRHHGSAPPRLRSRRAVRGRPAGRGRRPGGRLGGGGAGAPPTESTSWSGGRPAPAGSHSRCGRTAARGCCATGSCRRPAAFGLAFAVCENQVTALVDAGEGWQPVLTERTKVAELVDLRREDVLDGYAYAWGGRGRASWRRSARGCSG